MFLGAWLDAGVQEDRWRKLLQGLALEGYEIRVRRVKKKGIEAVKVDVEAQDCHPHRHLADILAILDRSRLPSEVREKARTAFYLLAEAEGRVHGLSPEQIHFHEVGAVDAIVDIVGAMAGWYLAGMPECFVSPVEVGGGWTDCEHGRVPVPAPATVELLKGFPVYSSGLWGETVTPTGAAIIRALCKPADGLRFAAGMVGYGAGTRELEIANVLRIQLGRQNRQHGPAAATATGANRCFVVETNIDDMNPEWAGYIIPRLLAVGASDAYLVPIVMKKGRPGLQLRVLCTADRLDDVKGEIFKQTSSIGLRYYEIYKEGLDRRIETVNTPYGPVRVKIAFRDGQVLNVAPEYEDCRKLAEEQNVPLKRVYWAAFKEVRWEDLP